jgi:hypothetical protein
MEQVFAVNGFSWIAYLALYFGGMVIASVYDIIKERGTPTLYPSVHRVQFLQFCLHRSFLIRGGKYFFAVLPIPGIILDLFILLIASIWLNNLEII